MRDKRNPESVKSALSEIDEAISHCRHLMLNATDSELKQGLAEGLIEYHIDRCVASYSSGIGKGEFQDNVLKLIEDFSNYFVVYRPYYDYVCDVVSMALLADIKTTDFKKIVRVLARDKVSDKLLNYLIKSMDMVWSDEGAGFIQKKPYSKLNQAIDEKRQDAGLKEVERYLKGWYKANGDAPWHGTHMLEEGNAYVGYWSWEAAALVKSKGWDDENLKDNEFYPYDAVHW